MQEVSRAMPKNPSWFHRFRWWIVGTAVTSLLPAVSMALASLNTNENRAADWLPATTPEMRQFFWFCDVFEGDEILVVSWDGCTLDDRRLDHLAEAAVRPVAAGRRGDSQVWFTWVRTGRSVLQELTADPLNLPQTEALRRMANWIVGADGRTTCAVLKVSDAGEGDRRAAVAAIRRVAEENCGLTPSELRIGGSTYDSVAIDDESQKSLRVLLVVSLIASIGTSLIFVRSPRFVCLILMTAALCEAWSLAAVWLSGTNMDLVLTMMPILIGILAVSAAIHQLNYYQAEVERRGVEGAPARALRQSWRPAAFSCLTTSLGLLSLLVSDVVPVRKFGLFSAIGIGVSLVVIFVFLPAALECWPGGAAQTTTLLDERSESRRRYRRSWARLFALASIRRYRLILTICGAAAPVLIYGSEQIRTSVKLQDMFSPRSKVIQNYRWLEANIGPLVPVEIVVKFNKQSQSTLADRLNLVEDVRAAVDAIPHVGGTLSAGTFAPVMPRGGGARQVAVRRIALRKLEKAKPQLEQTHYLAVADEAELWRISARIETFNDIDYGIFLEQLRGVVDPLIAEADRNPEEDVSALVTGGIPTFYLVQRQLLEDLRSSFGAAFLAIALVLGVALRNIRASLVTMIPNVYPILVVFGVMGLAGVVVDLGSMMTISTALGISVDNELHFFHWFRGALRSGHGRRRALLTAYRRCGRSMAQTAMICCLGMLVFTCSPFTPVSRFGALMSSLIALAMAGDQLLLPALLVSPLGTFFRGRSLASSAEAVPVEADRRAAR